MKGKPTQSPKLTLGDVAYIFQGVGTRDLKIGNEALLGYEAFDKLDRTQVRP